MRTAGRAGKQAYLGEGVKGVNGVPLLWQNTT